MEFPDTIEGFGYTFNDEGKLRSIINNEPYQFHVKENNQSYNQMRYEALGELITPAVYELLEEKCGLKRFPVPLNPAENEPKSFIYCTENFQSADKLLILIHGSGVVRAGQWARRLIINDCLNSGTQIPFINRGIEENYGVLVMNTNDNVEIRDGKRLKIKGSESPDEHGKYVWKNYVRKCKASKVAIVAHSYGGVVLTELADQFSQEFHNRVFAVALTDSVHCGIPTNSNLLEVARNWVGSQKPLDTPVKMGYRKDIACVSAGCVEHEMTSWSSFESIFKFFAERLAESEHSESLEKQASLEADSQMKTDPLSDSAPKNEDHPSQSENKDSLMEESQPSTKSERKDDLMEEDQPSKSANDSLMEDSHTCSKSEIKDSEMEENPVSSDSQRKKELPFVPSVLTTKDAAPGDVGNLKRKFCSISPTENLRSDDCDNKDESDPELD